MVVLFLIQMYPFSISWVGSTTCLSLFLLLYVQRSGAMHVRLVNEVLRLWALVGLHVLGPAYPLERTPDYNEIFLNQIRSQ